MKHLRIPFYGRRHNKHYFYRVRPAENYILDCPEPFRGMLLHLQSVIERAVPDVVLKFKYHIPFYYLEGRPFCYLNQTKNYVDVGFWNAAHLSKHVELMTIAGRKVMRSLRYKSLEEIDDAVLVEVLQDAYRVKNKKFYK